ncbi:hypothetical protein [Mycolicibacter sinensis]|nr:hypothetical protein [Mycolicibacter sinensis]
MKVFDPDTKEYRKTRRISDRLPSLMAAVYLYAPNRRTTLLALDFDTKQHGQAQVDADFAQALTWLSACGARVITDRSTNGGRHILVPLAIGTTASFAEIQPLMRHLKARLPSLDPKPTQNPSDGCISVPGTPCAGGGYRILDGPLPDAVAALTERSDPRLLPALYAAMGALPATTAHQGLPADPTTIGIGDDQRLPEHTRWNKPLPSDVAEFAATGRLVRSSWASPSEARMSVVLNAVLRGYSLADIRTQAAPGHPWAGLGEAYRTKYGIHADPQLARDVRKALHYASTLAVNTNPGAHRTKYTHSPALKGSRRNEALARWLAYALAWADREFSGTPLRWTVRDVFQALAIKAAVAGEMKSGTPVVGVGGRALSLSAGLLSATATFDVLRRTRDMVGAPIVLARHRIGRDADFYALTTSNAAQITATALDRVMVADVHPAWSVLGRQHRAVYELIAYTGLSRPGDIYAAAKVSPRSGQLSLAALSAAGLITRAGQTVTVGATTLDDIAAAHRLDEVEAERIVRYRRERAVWHAWLAIREQLRGITPQDIEHAQAGSQAADIVFEPEYLEAVMADGPPPSDEEHSAIELIAELMGGARILAVGSS